MQVNRTGGRHVGVAIPEGQNAERSNLPTHTVTNIMDLEFKGIQYVDHNGVLVQTLAVVDADGNVYEAPDGSKWLRGLLPFKTKIAENVRAIVRASAPLEDVPLEDGVDIIAEEMSREGTAASG